METSKLKVSANFNNEVWRLQAECSETDKSIFFGPGEDGEESRRQKRRREVAAINICNRCAVIDKCLEYAVLNNEYGIWGGTNDKERRSIYIRRKIYSKQEDI